MEEAECKQPLKTIRNYRASTIPLVSRCIKVFDCLCYWIFGAHWRYLCDDSYIIEPSYLDASVLSENLVISRDTGTIRRNGITLTPSILSIKSLHSPRPHSKLFFLFTEYLECWICSPVWNRPLFYPIGINKDLIWLSLLSVNGWALFIRKSFGKWNVWRCFPSPSPVSIYRANRCVPRDSDLVRWVENKFVISRCAGNSSYIQVIFALFYDCLILGLSLDRYFVGLFKKWALFVVPM